MGKTLILAIDELAQSQVQAFQTVNDALAALEQAHNRGYSVTTITSGTDHALSEVNFTRNFVFAINAAITTLTVPSTVNSNTTSRVFVVRNNQGSSVTVKSDGTGSTVSVPAGESRFLFAEGLHIYSLAS